MNKYIVVLLLLVGLILLSVVFWIQQQDSTGTTWSMYQNKELGLSFNQPPDWEVEELQSVDPQDADVIKNVIGIHGSGAALLVFTKAPSDIKTLAEWPEAYGIPEPGVVGDEIDPVEVSNIKTSQTNLGGIPAIKYTFTTRTLPDEQAPSQKTTQIFFGQSGNFLMVHLIENEHKPIDQVIFQSFLDSIELNK